MNRQGRAGAGSLDEPREHHPAGAILPRSHDVEEAQVHGARARRAEDPVEGLFTGELRCRVTPAPAGREAAEVAGLREGGCGLGVDLRGGGGQHTGADPAGPALGDRTRDRLAQLDVLALAELGIGEHGPDAHPASEVDHHLGFRVEKPGEQGPVRGVPLDDLEQLAPGAFQAREVARREVVQGDHPDAGGDEPPGHGGADEAGGAGDECGLGPLH